MKQNNFMITITDLNGSRNYVLSQIIKKFVIYILLIIIMLVILSALYVNYLSNLKDEAKAQLDELSAKNEMLLEAKKSSEQLIASLEAKFSEEYGLDINTSVQNGDLVETITSLVLSGTQEYMLFSGVPNGDPTAKVGRITDKFGARTHPILKHTQMHAGLDFSVPMGTAVVATADGVIQSAGLQNGYGHVVEIRHNYGFGTRYGHLNGKYNVKVGDFVKKGDVIAYSGNSGLSTGPHLHYEVRFIQKPLDPLNFVVWQEKNYKEIFEKERQVNWQSLVKLLSIQNKLQ